MVKAGWCIQEFLSLLLDLVHTVWVDKGVPWDWVDAILIAHSQKVVMCQGQLERDVLIGHGWEGDS